MKINVHHNGLSCRHNHLTMRATVNCYRLILRELRQSHDNLKGHTLKIHTER